MINLDSFRTVLVGYGTVFLLMTTLWIVHRSRKNMGIIDVGWAFSFGILATVYALPFYNSFTKIFFLSYVILLFWSMRLGLYLLKRFMHESGEDARYTKIKADWDQKGTAYFWMFLFQGSLAWFLSLPIFVLFTNSARSLLNREQHFLMLLGMLTMVVGILIESMADWQLKRFKHRLSTKGTTCKEGLWRYSRHPNYFGEWLVWVGLSITCLGFEKGYLTLYAPIIMYFMLTRFSGIQITEENTRRKGNRKDFEEYFQTTSAFFPWPPKKTSNSF